MKPTSGIDVWVRIPAGLRVRETTLQSPDAGGPETLKMAAHEGAITFKMPRLQLYDLILLKLTR
jgi:hypothetical protein